MSKLLCPYNNFDIKGKLNGLTSLNFPFMSKLNHIIIMSIIIWILNLFFIIYLFVCKPLVIRILNYEFKSSNLNALMHRIMM